MPLYVRVSVRVRELVVDAAVPARVLPHMSVCALIHACMRTCSVYIYPDAHISTHDNYTYMYACIVVYSICTSYKVKST